LPSFPSRGFFSNTLDEKFIETRRVDLNKYLEQLTKNSNLYTSKPVLRLFKTSGVNYGNLNVKDSKDSDEDEDLLLKKDKKSSQVNSNHIAETPNIWPQQIQIFPQPVQFFIQELPPPPPFLTIPPIIQRQSTNEECFIHPVLDHLTDCLRFFAHVDRQLAAATSIDQRLNILDGSKGRLTTEASTLVEEKQLIAQIIEEPRVQMDRALFDYFHLCYALIDRAVVWEKNVEEIVLQQLGQQNNFSNTELEQRISNYEVQAQELIVQAISSGPEMEEAKKKIKNIIQRC